MSKPLVVIIEKEGKWFIARSLHIGVVSQGLTAEEAQKNLAEAIGLYEGASTNCIDVVAFGR